MNTIYLVGQISPKFEITYKWRENVRNILSEVHDIEIIDPCVNNFNKQISKAKQYAISHNHREAGIDVLPSKDLTYVLRSNIAIVNLNKYDPNKELLGSYFELSWLYLHPEKTVIAFADDLNSYNCQHPFVKQTVHTWCNNEEEACDIVLKYFTSGGL